MLSCHQASGGLVMSNPGFGGNDGIVRSGRFRQTSVPLAPFMEAVTSGGEYLYANWHTDATISGWQLLQAHNGAALAVVNSYAGSVSSAVLGPFSAGDRVQIVLRSLRQGKPSAGTGLFEVFIKP